MIGNLHVSLVNNFCQYAELFFSAKESFLLPGFAPYAIINLHSRTMEGWIMIVVSAGIVIRDDRIMLCQRRPGDRMGLKWEFPGGKLESGESPQQALERELREELAIETRTGRIFDVRHESFSDRSLLLLFFRSEIVSGEPQPIECNAIDWVNPADLTRYDLAPSDLEVARRLAAEF